MEFIRKNKRDLSININVVYFEVAIFIRVEIYDHQLVFNKSSAVLFICPGQDPKIFPLCRAGFSQFIQYQLGVGKVIRQESDPLFVRIV